MRPVDIVAPHDDDRQLEALLVRVHEHLGRRLARGVGVRRRQDARLDQLVVVLAHLAVHLVRRDVHEAPDAAHLPRALEQHVRAVDVGVREAVRVAEAQVDVRLRGEVQHGVDAVALHAVDHVGRVRDIALVEGEVGPVCEEGRVVEGGAVVELVEGDDVVRVGVGQREVADQPAGTKSLGQLLWFSPFPSFVARSMGEGLT